MLCMFAGLIPHINGHDSVSDNVCHDTVVLVVVVAPNRDSGINAEVFRDVNTDGVIASAGLRCIARALEITSGLAKLIWSVLIDATEALHERWRNVENQNSGQNKKVKREKEKKCTSPL